MNDNKNILISILIVTKNQCKILMNAIESVTEQINNEIIEIIIIDGKSEDDTINVVKKYEKIKFISEEDSGIYNAMNKAIKLSTGKFIYFLGSDDYLIHKNIIENIKKILEKNENEKRLLYFKVLMSPINIQYPIKEINKTDILRGEKLCLQGLIMRRKDVQKLNGFDERFKIAADQDLIIRAIKEGIVLNCYDLILASYGIGGISSKGSVNETILILIKNKLFKNAIRFACREYLSIIYSIFKKFLKK
jgi:glycosyltransferase involved in cell wall biosynthesis